MPKAVDKNPQKRGLGASLWNPNRSGIASFQDPMSAIDDTVQQAGVPINAVLHNLLGLFNLGGIGDFLGSLFNGTLPTPQQVWEEITALFIKPLGMFAELVGGVLSGAVIPILDATKVLGLPQLINNVTRGFANFFEAWFGVPSSATNPEEAAEEVVTTVAAIKSAVLDGYTVAIFTSSDPAWPLPETVNEMIGVVIGGGGRGEQGQSGSNLRLGGDGGSSGGYLSAELDLTGLTPGVDTLAITVGAAATTPGAHGGISSIAGPTGTLLASAPNAAGISTKEGLLATTSIPGRGGRGGNANGSGPSGEAGEPGEASGVGPGGAGGSGASTPGTGGTGGSGAVGRSTDVPLCGGSGGGGGGGRATNVVLTSVTGGTGGNGGFPGGGSGGGGAASNNGGFPVESHPGTPGIPGNGLVALIYK